MRARLKGAGPGFWLGDRVKGAVLAVLVLIGSIGFGPSLAFAQAAVADVAQLNTMTRTIETFEVMRQEGLLNDKVLAEDLLGNAEDPTWARVLDDVYSVDRMTQIYSDRLLDFVETDPGLAADVSVFLTSDLGQRIIDLELEARRTALDPLALGAAQEVYADMQRSDRDRLALIERLVVAGDLMDGNVSTAMNANMAFARAIGVAGNFGGPVDEETLLADIWAQEPDIRASVADFLFPLMALAYAPLTIQELQAYVDFYESDVGQRFNAAVMAAFEPVMVDLSGRLGAEAGKLMSGQAL